MRPCVIALAALFLAASPAGLAAQDFDEAVAVLARAETIDDAAVGFAGVKSDNYRAYEALRAAATPAQLRGLLDHERAVVRCYAARALVESEVQVDWAAVLGAHLADTAEVTTFEGCIQAKTTVGDYLFELARTKRLLAADAELDLAERLVREKSPLYARSHALRTLRFRDGMLHEIRTLAKKGDSAAAIALARYGLAADVPVLIDHLRQPDPFDDNCRFLAAEISGDPRLLPPLLLLEDAARERIGRDNPLRLRFWLRAIAVHRNEAAADFLLRVLRQPIASEHKRRNMRETMAEVLAPHADVAVYAPLRAALAK